MSNNEQLGSEQENNGADNFYQTETLADPNAISFAQSAVERSGESAEELAKEYAEGGSVPATIGALEISGLDSQAKRELLAIAHEKAGAKDQYIIDNNPYGLLEEDMEIFRTSAESHRQRAEKLRGNISQE